MILPTAILAGALTLTNQLSFTTNSVSGTTTNKDSVFGMIEPFLSLNLAYPVLNASGHSINSITQSGVYTLVGDDGRGYQQVVTFSSITTNFAYYVGNSLANHVITNLQGRTNGLSPSASASMFSTANYATTNFAWNSSFWLSNSVQKTSIAAMRNGGAGAGPTAISARHVITANHAALTNDSTLVFVDDFGSNYYRIVTATTNWGSGTTDLSVSLLNSNLPSTIHPCTVLPTNCNAWLNTWTNAPQVQLVGVNQDRKMFPRLANTPYATTLYANSSALWLNTGWNVGIRGGDSGMGIFMLIKTNLVLIGDWFEASPDGILGYGPNYAANFTAINTAMHTLSTVYSAGSDYQLTTNDMTGFPTY